MATPRDIEEVIGKLSSDKAKTRDEGVKLLSTWLQGERAIGFCWLLGRNTARIKPGNIPGSETWPFLITVLVKCIMLEIAASKKRPPKIMLAKTLRAAVQCAEDPKLSGQSLLLISVVKLLFNHIWEVVKDIASFQSEYSIILRHLLTIKEYRYQMKLRTYSSFVVLYLKKVVMGIDGKYVGQSSSKEEVFRSTLTLHVLLENPPGDYPDDIMEDVIKGFCEIFSHVREEGKITRKLMECINTYLLKDGPNLGCKAMELHCAVQDFMFHCWLTTHDRAMKSSFIVYAKVQLKLSRGISDGSHIVEQLFDVIVKELDQNVTIGAGLLWSETPRDEKAGSSRSIQEGLMGLAAAVFYLACRYTPKTSNREKRLKMEDAASLVTEGLLKGSWLWNGAVCFLINNYGLYMNTSLLIEWFQASCETLKRVLTNVNAIHFQDTLLWLLRALKEFSAVLSVHAITGSQCLLLTKSEMSLVKDCWQDIWSSLIHGLPLFTTATSVVDSALTLLGIMILRDQVGIASVSQDVWDLRIFKHVLSSSALYFIACYFSKIGFQGDLGNAIFVRKKLLRSALELVHSKEFSLLNEQNVVLIPESIFAICTGCATSMITSGDTSVLLGENKTCFKLLLDEGDLGLVDELGYSVEALAEIKLESSSQVKSEECHWTHLPGSIKQPLLVEFMDFIHGSVISNEQFLKVDLSNLVFVCSLLCNIIYCAVLARFREEKSSIFPAVLDYVAKIVTCIVSAIEDKCKGLLGHGFANVGLFDSTGTTLSSFRSFMSSPLFSLWRDKNGTDSKLLYGIIGSLDKLLAAVSKLFSVVSSFTNDLDIEINNQMLPASSLNSSVDINPIVDSKNTVVDMDLDARDSGDIDSVTTSGSGSLGMRSLPLQWKLEIVSVITTFFSVSPHHAWEILYNLMVKENDVKVRETMLLYLCANFPAPYKSLSALVQLIIDMMDRNASSQLNCSHSLSTICALLRTLLAIYGVGQSTNEKPHVDKMILNENLDILSDLVNKASEISLLDWFLRIRLIDCISYFISLEPSTAQVMIERLLAMLHDTDFRVRLYLARKIGVLFQIWEGHNELFHDICLNIGVEMVRFSNESLIKARDVLAVSPQPVPVMETTLVTLAHLALHSEEIEVECVFMMCVVAAIEPSQRELTYALFDSLSRRLHYPSRSKYLEQLTGSILVRWVACEVSLVSLVEVQEMFSFKPSDPKHFLEYCCPWLLPVLILRGETTGLHWISKILCQPLSALVKEYFVPIFAVSMAVKCSTRPEKEMAETVLCESILQFGEISELERDDLIKKHMVSIVGFLLLVSSSALHPEIPSFSREVLVLSIKTIVDGFVETTDYDLTKIQVTDKINIFRVDRVFKFLLEIHHQVTDANHPRHMSHRLSAIEVLLDVLGHRVILYSTSFYIINIIGNYIGRRTLQGQCCNILSKLLDAFKANSSTETVTVLGEQLQFLVSKLVACCIPVENEEVVVVHPSGVISLLRQLIVEADPSFYNYIRELEPFPDLDCLKDIQIFHNGLCSSCTSRDQFLKFVKRAPYLPPRLFLLSLHTHHKKLVSGDIINSEAICVDNAEGSCWHSGPDIVSAIWSLVDICCSSSVANEATAVLADFIARVGICDPHQVIFHLPEICQKHPLCSSNIIVPKEDKSGTDYGISEDIVVKLLRLLKTYLSSDSVEIIDVTSQTLRGILSTEMGQNALRSLDPHDRSLMTVHSKGVNMAAVEKLLLETEKSTSVSLDSNIWLTEGKTYDKWVCSLVNSLISHCDDIILRLCSNIVSLKVEAAELLFASALVNLAGKVGSNAALCKLISSKVEQCIFCESNNLMKSVHIFLDALNVARSIYVAEKARTFSYATKDGRSSTAKTHYTSEKSKDRSPTALQSSSWKKVYWLSVDYLVVARAAIRCSRYFTAVVYVELWCEEQFNGLALGPPDFSHHESLPPHIGLLVAAFTHINEPDSIYGITLTNETTSHIIRYEHEGNWSSALEYYDLLVRSAPRGKVDSLPGSLLTSASVTSSQAVEKLSNWKLYKGLMRSLQKTGCGHVLDVYSQGLTNQKEHLQQDSEFIDIQYEAAWRAGNWDFSFFIPNATVPSSTQYRSYCLFNENLHSCFRALQEGDSREFLKRLTYSKMDLVSALSNASKESTKYIHSTVLKLQMLDHLNMSWDLRWKLYPDQRSKYYLGIKDISPEPVVPSRIQLEFFSKEWSFILHQTEPNLDLLEPFLAFRRVLLQMIDCKKSLIEHLLQSASALRKGSRFSLAAAALYELKELCCQGQQQTVSNAYFLARLEEAKLLRAQGQHDMAISLGKYMLQSCPEAEEIPNVYRLVGKWLAESRSSNSRTIIEQYLKHSVKLTESSKSMDKKHISRQCQTYFHLAHYTDGLFKSYEERLSSNEWQAALRLRKYRTKELDTLIKRLKSSSKGEKTDYSVKIQELQKQLAMDREEAKKIQDDRDKFLSLALEGYQRSLVIGGKYDLRVVFRLVSLWFNLFSREQVVKAMIRTTKEVKTYKFIPLVYQIASRLGSAKDAQGSTNFQTALASLLRKMAIDHPYHTIFQLLALANGDRVKDKQRSRSSFVVDMDKKLAAENLLNELSSYHGALIREMKQMVEVYIKLAELETKKEDTNKRIPLPREIRSLRQLELVPVVTATIPVDPDCQYGEGSFPYFKGIADSVMIMNGINAPKVVECLGSDGKRYRQLAKSGNDDLRQDAVMEQFFGLVNMFLQNHKDTWKRRLRIRTYKVVPFTPSAGVVEWVNGTIPLGEYLLGSTRSGGAHGRYGIGDWSFLQCREYMASEKNKRKAFLKVCNNFRPVMHHFFLERFLQPADWFESRLAYTRSVAASSMVGYIVGLGDRHSMNILIDQDTAEVVHIDLGVAFEQGLMLKTPERVPFRLTRDIIDGMGVTGVEGVFRRCCEETLSVMRANEEALLTIIEVFIHDPLYKWALSPLKALQRQKETDDDTDSCLDDSQGAYEGNKDAARAIFRVKQKLDGYEDGEMRSVQGQVQQLIQDAVDVDRLCQMFPGWGAWL